MRRLLCLISLALALGPACPRTAAAAPVLAPPPELNDGLAVGDPQAGLADPGPLTALADAIGRGDIPKTNAVLIVSRGRLVYEGYFGAGRRDLLNDTRSAMKSVTSLAVGLAIQSGAIGSVKAPAFSYLEDLAPFANDGQTKRQITIEDLLTMSSALACNDDDDASPGNENNMHPQHYWARWAVDLPTIAGYARDGSGLGPWRYCTAGAFLLGQILQRAVGEPADKYIDERILAPLGVTKFEWPYSPSGEAMTGGGLRLSARDLAKLAWMLVDDGRWSGSQVIPSAWVDAAFTVRRPAYFGLDYGYLFWRRVYHTPCGDVVGWQMSGNGGNAVVMLRAIHAAVVVARADYNTKGMHQQTQALLETYVLPALMCARSAA